MVSALVEFTVSSRIDIQSKKATNQFVLTKYAECHEGKGQGVKNVSNEN